MDVPAATGITLRRSLATYINPNNVPPLVGKVACLTDLSTRNALNRG
jgi:hypothetical protein